MTLRKIANVSTRTLGYYHEINLLYPKRTNSSGYRIYGEKEVDKLQQILFYKSLGFKLEDIKNIINSPSFDIMTALNNHKKELIKRRKEIDLLIENVEKTISYKKGRLICQIKKNLKLSKKWLEYSWNFYSKEAHRNLGEMYVLDERFKKYYDNNQEGMAEFFRDALNIYTK